MRPLTSIGSALRGSGAPWCAMPARGRSPKSPVRSWHMAVRPTRAPFSSTGRPPPHSTRLTGPWPTLPGWRLRTRLRCWSSDEWRGSANTSGGSIPARSSAAESSSREQGSRPPISSTGWRRSVRRPWQCQRSGLSMWRIRVRSTAPAMSREGSTGWCSPAPMASSTSCAATWHGTISGTCTASGSAPSDPQQRLLSNATASGWISSRRSSGGKGWRRSFPPGSGPPESDSFFPGQRRPASCSGKNFGRPARRSSRWSPTGRSPIRGRTGRTCTACCWIARLTRSPSRARRPSETSSACSVKSRRSISCD